jgi:dTDP-glucose pyrophosphorylase
MNKRAIIPAAGFGTRMNMPVNQSKELLSDPGDEGRPMIEKHIRQARAHNYEPLVITRPEKQDLIDYLVKYAVPLMLHTPESGSEWPDTILASKPYWGERNVLILPDTVYKPFDIVWDLDLMLDLHDLAFAVHTPPDPQNWGVLDDNKVLCEYRLCEKPTNFPPAPGLKAWGLIAWSDNDVAQKVFEGFKNRHLWFDCPADADIIHLEEFKDITRSNSDRKMS